MKIHPYFFGLVLLFVVWSACKNQNGNASSTAGANTGTSSTSPTLPFLQSAEVSKLYSIAENVDIIFYDLPISVNQDDPTSAKNSVLYVQPAAPNLTSTCQPVGRLSWISNGKIVKEADFYIGEGCNHFVFMENGLPAYKNAMSLEGVQFFQTIMSQVRPPDKK
jgi:hypothetical protein